MTLVLILLFPAAAVLLFIRNEWVFRTQKRWIGLAGDYARHRAHTAQDYLELMSIRFDDIYAAVADYDTMMLRFWQWSLDSFVVNEPVYRAVIEHHEQQATL